MGTLGNGTRRTCAVLTLVAALAVLATSTADARQSSTDAHQRGAGGRPHFTWPPAGVMSYATAGKVTISWDPGTSGATRWRLRQLVGHADVDGSCAATDFSSGLTIQTSRNQVSVPNHHAGSCYRYKVRAADPAGNAGFISGTLRVLSLWTGSIDLYRKGVFSTQATLRWCVAASIQMMINITLNQKDHRRSTQARYIRYARRHDRYPPSVPAKGSDPQGWVVGLNHFSGSSSYHWVASHSFRWAVQSAARRLRQTGKPVGLIVLNSNHAWVMTGFHATADPATGSGFRITSVNVMGPLYPLRQRAGYDPAPDTRISVDRLRGFLTRYRDSRGTHNPWEGSYITIQP
jgi:hypothetical protein